MLVAVAMVALSLFLVFGPHQPRATAPAGSRLLRGPARECRIAAGTDLRRPMTARPAYSR
jgi:hypothetical protein